MLLLPLHGPVFGNDYRPNRLESHMIECGCVKTAEGAHENRNLVKQQDFNGDVNADMTRTAGTVA